jgi:hypothetical protein
LGGCDTTSRREVIQMTRVAAWHSVKPYDPQVYHDETRCKTGHNIEAENRRSGTGNRPRCKECADYS